MSRVAISWSDAAVSTSRTISPASSSRIANRSLRVQLMLGLHGFFDDHAVLAVVLAHPYRHALSTRRREVLDRKSTRLNSSHRCISYAVFCLKKKKQQ